MQERGTLCPGRSGPRASLAPCQESPAKSWLCMRSGYLRVAQTRLLHGTGPAVQCISCVVEI